MKKKGLLTLFGVLVLLSLSCSKSDIKAPIFDGLFLLYKSENTTSRYEFKLVSKNRFKMTIDTNYKIQGSDHSEYFLSETGKQEWKIFGKLKGDIKGVYSRAWIPINKLKVGNNLGEGFVVEKKEKWHDWDVLTVGNKELTAKEYYDAKSGFLVGYGGIVGNENIEFVLTETNANIFTNRIPRG